MKKVLVLLFAAVAMSLPSQAQVKFGLKGGLNLTSSDQHLSQWYTK